MTDGDFDLDAWLRSHDPLDQSGHAVTGTQTDQMLDDVRRRIAADRRRRAVVVAAAVAVVVCAAAAWVSSRSAKDPTTVACHSSAGSDADAAVVPAGSDPLAACREAWTDPAFHEVFGGSPAPALTACVSEEGDAVVYPARGEDPCERLDLDRLSGATADANAVQAFEAVVSEQMIARCVPLTEAERIVLDALDDAGLDDWTVISPPDRNAGDCGSIAIDVAGRTVRLVPIPPPPTN